MAVEKGRGVITSNQDYFAHETACIDGQAEVGSGTKIWHFTHVMSGARIGRNCNIGQNVFIASTAVLGNNVKVQNNVSIYDGVILEDNVFCGPSMVFTNVLNPRCEYPRNRLEGYKKTLVRAGTTIGANATILCGITIGRYAFIGAGAVVTHDVPDYALIYGNPARVKGWACECGVKLNFTGSNEEGEEACCSECQKAYLKKDQNHIRRIDQSRLNE